MFDKLSSLLLRTSDYSAFRKEYANEDEAYVLYMLKNAATNNEKTNTRKSA